MEVRPRPGVYGLEIAASLPIRDSAVVIFKYPRYFASPAKARAIFGSDIVYERALAVGRVPARRHARAAPLDQALPRPAPGRRSRRAGSYLVAAPQ